MLLRNLNETLLTETYVEKLQHLRSYLSMSDDDKAIDAAFIFSYYLPEWVDEFGKDIEVGEDNLDAIESMSKEEQIEFGEWIINQKYAREDDIPAGEQPSWMFFDKPSLIMNQWLVHRSNYADKIEEEGFKHLIYDLQNLGLTTWHKRDSMYRSAEGHGYGFAYTLNDFRRYDNKNYGDEVAIFQGSGIRVWHYGDEEYQTIFWGPSAKNINYINAGGEIKNKKTGRIIFDGKTIERAVDWFINNQQQYRRVLN